jgi:hypothetical protein
MLWLYLSTALTYFATTLYIDVSQLFNTLRFSIHSIPRLSLVRSHVIAYREALSTSLFNFAILPLVLYPFHSLYSYTPLTLDMELFHLCINYFLSSVFYAVWKDAYRPDPRPSRYAMQATPTIEFLSQAYLLLFPFLIFPIREQLLTFYACLIVFFSLCTTSDTNEPCESSVPPLPPQPAKPTIRESARIRL